MAEESTTEVVPTDEQLPAPIEEAADKLTEAEQRLKSEDLVISAPMSYAGSAARIWKLTRIPGADNAAAKIALGFVAVVLIALAWTLVSGWYLIFGLLLVPYRLIRRGQRKRKVEEARHRELLVGMQRSS